MSTIIDRIKTSFFASDSFLRYILFPFLSTRIGLLVVAYYASGNYLSNPTYQKYVDRGFFLTHLFPIDIFSRWDSAAYFSIITRGYSPSSDIRSVYSNIAFFPLYPYLVKSFGWLGLHLPDGFYVAFGILLSNLFFLAAAVLLLKLVTGELGFSETVAGRTIGLLIFFPTSFIFSSFYTESLFLFLLVAGTRFAFQGRWKLVAVTCFLLLLARAQGIVAWGIFLLFYFEKRKWDFQAANRDILWLFLAPVGLVLHLAYLYNMTGEPLAPFAAMTAWGRANASILENLRENLASPYLDVFKIDLGFTIIFVILSMIIVWKWPVKSLGLFALSMSVLPVASGLLVSVSRYLLLVFPVFIYAGAKLEESSYYDAVRVVLFSLQVVYFAGWVNYYWIV
ncbi:MAG: hypothetical protein GX577_07255 [Leptolinea sp.]|nr:hypothetical protein [Leptolinea sp.]